MKFLAIIFLTFITQISYADYQGELYGNSQAEREIKWVWRHLADFVISCNASQIDCQDPKIKKVISELADYLPKNDYVNMSEWDKLLVFVSEKDRPDLFLSTAGEVHRVAITELKKKSKVYINTDRMDLPYETWIGLLAHEVIHHLEYTDDEQRLPDQVGTEIVKHTKSQIQIATLEQFKLPSSRIVTFNSVALGKGSSTLISSKNKSSDMGWTPNNLLPLCNFQIEEFISQYVTAPAWQVNRVILKKSQVAIRGTGHMKFVCRNKSTKNLRTGFLPLDKITYLKYDQQIDLNSWKDMTPTQAHDNDRMGFGANTDLQVFGPAQTFFMISNKHENTKINSGMKWKTTLKIQGTDDFNPTACHILFSGSQYSYIPRDGLPSTNTFDSCSLKSLGQRQWEITAETTIPDFSRPDFFYISAIALVNSSNQNRFAVPTYPNYIEVSNPTSSPAALIKDILITGLDKATKFRDFTATNSYLAKPDQTFSLILRVEGTQQILEAWFDLTLWLKMQDTFAPAHATGGIQSFPLLVKNHSIRTTSYGTEVRLDMALPDKISNYQLAAVKFTRFYMKTSDFSWVEIEIPDSNDTMVINRQFGQ